MEKIFCDVAIIGGGPAGMMASISAAENKKKVVLIEKNDVLGKKLLLTGGGRCNMTNAMKNKKQFVSQYGKNGEFFHSAFSVFDNKKTLDFFQKIGIRTKEENGKIFPKTDNAKDVLNALLAKMRLSGVRIIENSPAMKIIFENGRILELITSKKQSIIAKNYILCTGGKSYPKTGSTGDGYEFARMMGHCIIEPKPALVPIKIKQNWPAKLQGLSLNNVRLSIKGKEKQISRQGDIIFTHFGISGPIAMDLSRDIQDYGKKIDLVFDFFPGFDISALDKRIEKILKTGQGKEIKNVLKILFPERLSDFLLAESGINEKKQCSQISKKERMLLCKQTKNTLATIDSFLDFESAIATKGGIDLFEIDSKTMKSKIIDNLFFAGEIIDLLGPCGGFNLQLCWTTGYLAGKNASL